MLAMAMVTVAMVVAKVAVVLVAVTDEWCHGMVGGHVYGAGGQPEWPWLWNS